MKTHKVRNKTNGPFKLNLKKLLKEDKFLGKNTFILKQLLKSNNYFSNDNFQPTRIRSYSSSKEKNSIPKNNNKNSQQTQEDNNTEENSKFPDPKIIIKELFNLLTNNEEVFYNAVQKFNNIKGENEKFYKDFYNLKNKFNKTSDNYKKQNNIILEVLGGINNNSVFKANPLLFQTFKEFYYFFLTHPDINKHRLSANKSFQYVLKILKLINYKKYEEFETSRDLNKINEIRKFQDPIEKEEVLKQQISINKIQKLLGIMKKQKNFFDFDFDFFPNIRKAKTFKSYKTNKKANTTRINPYNVSSYKTDNSIIKHIYTSHINKKLNGDSISISPRSIKTSRTNHPSLRENGENNSKEKKNLILNKSILSNNSISSFKYCKKNSDLQRKVSNSRNNLYLSYVNGINLLKKKELEDSIKKSTVESFNLFRKKSDCKDKENDYSMASLINDIKNKSNSHNIFNTSRSLLAANLNSYRNRNLKLYAETNKTITNLDKKYLKTLVNFQIMTANEQ